MSAMGRRVIALIITCAFIPDLPPLLGAEGVVSVSKRAAAGVTTTSGKPAPQRGRQSYRRRRGNRFVRVLKAPYKAVKAVGKRFGTRRVRRRGTNSRINTRPVRTRGTSSPSRRKY